MSQLKCDPCRVRLQHDLNRSGPVSLACPNCGGIMEPAERLEQIVGYRAISGPLGADLADPELPEAISVALPPPRLDGSF